MVSLIMNFIFRCDSHRASRSIDNDLTSFSQISIARLGSHVAIIKLVVCFEGIKNLSLFAIIPNNKEFILVCLRINTFTMLFTLQKVTFIFSSVWPTVDSEAVFFALEIAALVDSTVRPLENTLSVHLVFSPFPLVFCTISP